MKSPIKVFNDTLTKVTFFFKQLQLKIKPHSTGRPLALNPVEIVSLALFKQTNGIPTKKTIWKLFELKRICSYKTLVVNLNRYALYALLILNAILKWNQKDTHPIKHTDSTDIPVCLTKNGKRHKTMQGLAAWAHGPKGWYYGLKMNITTDLKRNLLAVRFSAGNADDRKIFRKLNKDLYGIFVADAGYISKDLEKEFFIEHKRILFAKPRANMKKLATELQTLLYNTRMQIEPNFRCLKMFFDLVTSLPRSIDGYFGNYAYSLLAYVLR